MMWVQGRTTLAAHALPADFVYIVLQMVMDQEATGYQIEWYVSCPTSWVRVTVARCFAGVIKSLPWRRHFNGCKQISSQPQRRTVSVWFMLGPPQFAFYGKSTAQWCGLHAWVILAWFIFVEMVECPFQRTITSRPIPWNGTALLRMAVKSLSALLKMGRSWKRLSCTQSFRKEESIYGMQDHIDGHVTLNFIEPLVWPFVALVVALPWLSV